MGCREVGHGGMEVFGWHREGCWKWASTEGGVKSVLVRYSGLGGGKVRIWLMWSWFVFVISSVAWLHMGYERVRCSTVTKAYPTSAGNQ